MNLEVHTTIRCYLALELQIGSPSALPGESDLNSSSGSENVRSYSDIRRAEGSIHGSRKTYCSKGSAKNCRSKRVEGDPSAWNDEIGDDAKAASQGKSWIYTVTNPLGAAQNYALNKAFYPNGTRGSQTRSRAIGNALGVQTASGGGVRAEEAAASHEYIHELMAVQREKFRDAVPPVIPFPAPVDAKKWILLESKRRAGEAKPWEFKKRRMITAEVLRYAMDQAEIAFQGLEEKYKVAQADADKWWQDLIDGKKGGS